MKRVESFREEDMRKNSLFMNSRAKTSTLKICKKGIAVNGCRSLRIFALKELKAVKIKFSKTAHLTSINR